MWAPFFQKHDGPCYAKGLIDLPLPRGALEDILPPFSVSIIPSQSQHICDKKNGRTKELEKLTTSVHSTSFCTDLGCENLEK
jgi:hypothetical protein